VITRENKGKPLPPDNSSGGGHHRASSHYPLGLPRARSLATLMPGLVGESPRMAL